MQIKTIWKYNVHKNTVVWITESTDNLEFTC